jgi:hypothetical protein
LIWGGCNSVPGVGSVLKLWSSERDFAPALDCATFDQACVEDFLTGLAPRLFRRPLTTDETALYQAIIDAHGDTKAGIQLALEGMLSSPQFLYRHELGEPNPDNLTIDTDAYELTSYEMATFLSYTFAGTTPDQALLDAAANDELRSEAGILAQAQRLAGEAKGVMGNFVGRWLGTADLELAAKDADVFPGFSELVPHMKREITEMFAHVMLDPAEQFSSLYNADFTFLNEPLATHYGLSGILGDELRRVSTQGRGGILANGAFLARWAESVETSPILRSVRVRRRMLCQNQPDPPAGTFAAREEKLAELSDFLQEPATTNRMKYHRLTEDAPCTSCHLEYINPLGFEHLAAISDTQRRLDELAGGVACSAAPEGEEFALSDDTFTQQARLQADIAVAALQCGLTRSVSIAFGNHQCQFRIPELGYQGAYHQSIHGGSGGLPNYPYYTEMRNHLGSLSGYLIERLRGAGLLDSTVVVETTDMGHADRHSGQDVPLLIAGGGGTMRRGVATPVGGAYDNYDLLYTAALACGVVFDAGREIPGVLA